MSNEGFWTKIKQNTSNLSSNLSSLSLSTDSDGKASCDTLVHKSLVKFYQEQNDGQPPEWLIADDPKFQRVQQNQDGYYDPQMQGGRPQHGSDQYSRQSHQGQQQGHHTSNHQRRTDPHNKPTYDGGENRGNSYHQEQPSHQPSHQPHPFSRTKSAKTQTPASAGLHAMYKSSRNSAGEPGGHSGGGYGGGNSSGSGGAGGGLKSNAIRDRLKNNSRSQSSWAKR